ncbi:signal transduction histidine kinase [Lutibacter sp. Hel_I_33_5]|uniref:hybrid sensor histidine kinase/response regulator transcription factor n=1 Tax=Lutibacter sp. Hel_I_33_5 TaxID=1566289 RepID=UPI00119CD130|nr:hybrid sensor histidine kinase/response regulator transcription factor [Lutibacter sp. Hel_I_33_5]TVZ54959.1 signal transduction histidine kinase [Lutibacter sp. Hel_I_33_5]
MKKKYQLLILILCFVFHNINSQEFKYLKFKHLSSKDGLSQRSVIDIYQDKKGYIWFGTRDGLNKYDGYNFVIYRHNSEDSESLSHNWITTIHEDTYGNLWVGTKDGLNKYNPQKNNFKRYKHHLTKNSISDNDIWDLAEIEEGKLLIATNNGINELEVKKDSISNFNVFPQNSNSLLSDTRTRSFTIINNKLWISTVRGIDLFNLNDKTYSHYSYPVGVSINDHINNFPTLYVDQHENIWLGYEKGLSILDKSKNIFVDFKYKSKKEITSAVRSISEDYFGNLWIGTYSGLYIYNQIENTFNHILHNENDPKSLSQNSIYKIFKDSRGDMWIGTWAGGVNYFDKSFNVFKQFSSGNSKNMLNYKIVSGIIEDENKNLWIGTEGGGINFYNNKTQAFTYLTNNPKDKNSLSSNNVKSLIKDHNGNLWIGTHDKGLNFLNTKQKPYKFKTFNSEKIVGNANSNLRVLSLFEDNNNNLWVGTLAGGLYFHNTKTKSFYKLDNSIKSITSIVQSQDPNYLLVCGSQGLEKVNIHTRKQNKIVLVNERKEVITSKTMNCIYIDKDDNYWIGTEGDGLLYYNKDEKSVIKYGIAEGLPNEIVYGILGDENDNIWISTNKGISQINLISKKKKNFDVSDGLQGNEFNYNAFLKTSNNELMFGGVNGLTYFNPNDINVNMFVPKIDIYNLSVNNESYLKITDSISNITLKHDQNNFSVSFTGLSYSQSNKNNYAYKLDGFDKDWKKIGNNRTANYTNIDQGEYTFKVKVANNDGVWNEAGDSIILTILPAWWSTWWAFLIYTIIILGISYYINILISARIKVKNELIKEKDDRERIVALNKLKLKLFTNISHDFRTPLTLIAGPLQQLIENKKGDNETQYQLKGMYGNVITLLQLINQLLDFRKSDAGKLKIKVSKKNIVPFLKNVKLSFEELAKQRNINYFFITSKEVINVWFDPIELKKVIINLLSNAFKFTPNGGIITVNVSLSKEKKLKIEIKDTGDGIPKNELPNIFDRFFQLGDRNKIRTGTGVGLSLAKDIVELHKGKIDVKSSQRKGTSFIVLLPIGKEHFTSEEISFEDDEQSIEPTIFNEPTIFKPIQVEKKSEFKESQQSILLVEDNIEIRAFIKKIFIDNYNVYEAENGKIGIEQAQINPIDIIISDVMMPVMDGVKMCNAIKTDIKTSHIPIIMLTAKTSIKAHKKGYETGADIYVTKPFDTKILKLQVNNLLNLRKNMILKYKKDLLLSPKELTVTSADEKFLKKAFIIVEENMTESEFNTQLFTEKMNMSRTLLYTKIKALTGQSLSEFIRSIRLKKAAQLIAKTQMNISEIAYSLGFNDLKYFRNSFKKTFNTLPTKYRAKNKTTNTPIKQES